MPLTFFVPSLPIAQPRQRHTKAGHNYTPADHPVHAWRYALAMSATSAMPGQVQPWIPDGPVRLDFTLYFPRPKRLQWKTREWVPLWHAQTPDLENVQKALQDALTGVCWRDDAQIACVLAHKVFCGKDEPPGVRISVARLDATYQLV